MNKKFNYLYFILLIVVFISCQPIVYNLTNQSSYLNKEYKEVINLSPIPIKTQYGYINLKISLPNIKFGTDYLKKFNIKALPLDKINKVKIQINGLENKFSTEKMVNINVTGVQVNLEVPLGKNYIITVTGYNDLEEIKGTEVKSVFDILEANSMQNIEVNPKTTPLAKILEGISSKEPKNTSSSAQVSILSKLDRIALNELLNQTMNSIYPTFIDTDVFVKAIIDKNGEIPKVIPQNARIKEGTITGKISGLNVGDIAVVFCDDPSSQPQIVVSNPKPQATSTGGTSSEDKDSGIKYVIKNVTPGKWRVSIYASGYIAFTGNSSTDTLVDNTTYKIDCQVTAGQEASGIDFNLTTTKWNDHPINVSANIGSSDQVAVALDPVDNLHVVWRQDGFPDANSGWIAYSYWNRQNWSRERKMISPPGGENFRGALHPAIAVGIDRMPHVVWSSINANGVRKILYTKFDGTKWIEPIAISDDSYDTNNTWVADYPSIAINKINGYIYVVWQKYSVSTNTHYIFFTQYDGIKWLEPVRIATSLGNQPVMPKVAVTLDGVIHIVWKSASAQNLKYCNFDGKKWVGEETVNFGSMGADINNSFDIAVDDLNRVHIAWKNDTYIQYVIRSNNTWSNYEIANQVVGKSLPAQTPISLFIDSIGNVNLLWGTQDSNNNLIFVTRKRTNEGWEVPFNTQSTISAWPTPPGPSPSASASSSGTPSATPKIGYDTLPSITNRYPSDKPYLLIESTGIIHVIWSNNLSEPVNSDIYHFSKAPNIIDNKNK